jgi:prevent-host-death family protein
MPIQTVNIDEAKSQLADLITIALAGGEVVITQGGQPVARLVPAIQAKKKRIAGLNRGSIWTSQDFDEPLPDEFWAGQE